MFLASNVRDAQGCAIEARRCLRPEVAASASGVGLTSFVSSGAASRVPDAAQLVLRLLQLLDDHLSAVDSPTAAHRTRMEAAEVSVCGRGERSAGRRGLGRGDAFSPKHDLVYSQPACVFRFPSNSAPLEDIDDLISLLTTAANATARPLAADDFAEMGRRAQVFSDLLSALDGAKPPTAPLDRVAKAILDSLETSLYPWLRSGDRSTSAASLRNSYAGRGIVMTTGNGHYRYAYHCIISLRLVGSTLPIEVHYLGPTDLSKEHIAALSALNVTLVDLSLAFGLPPKDWRSWANKPFAMLASSFREMIFIDADALFFQPPETIFDSQAYRRTGAAFFLDRTSLGGGGTNIYKFSKETIGVPSEYAIRRGRMFGNRSLTLYEQESGVVVYDKVVHFHALLLAAKMNSNPWRDFMYSQVHGGSGALNTVEEYET
ncbi:mannosyltransferase putative-domain-containing protein, partial [Blyttiomyces helicus]